MGKFSLDLSAYIAKAKKDIELVVQRAVSYVAVELIDLSPVGDASLWKTPPPPDYHGGQFKANWTANVGAASSDVFFRTIDPTGVVSKSRIHDVLSNNFLMGKTIFINNNLPYAQRLEDGWSSQAPSGMVMKTVLRWNVIVDNAVNAVRSGEAGSNT